MRGFRAWHTKLNRYLKDDEFFIDADGKVRNDSFGRGNYEEAFDTSDFDNGYIILEQDTGLKDRNGKKIYEGDIVKFKWTKRLYVVTYRLYDASFILENDEWEETIHLSLDRDDFEVFGNIHMNPELLEEENERER